MGRVSGIIVGGGIGGLAAAVALRRAGIAVQVHERAPELREVGAGIGLWPNAIVALDRIGVGEAVRKAGVPLADATVRTSEGRIVSRTSLAELERRFGASTTVIHRATLVEILCAALPDGVVKLGQSCIGFEQGRADVAARFDDGSVATGDLLVGADGLHSAVRTGLHGESAPRFAGYTAWRAAVRFAGAIEAGESWGRGTRFGMFPMVGGLVYWFAVANAPEGAPRSADEKARLQERFARYHAPVPELIATTAAEAILRNDVYDRPPREPWGEGRVTLLGDAAHPMTPNLGQGACQAIEDAVVLASHLRGANGDGIPAALRAYEHARGERTRRIVERSRQFGELAQIESGPMIALRNAALRLVPASAQMREIEWLARFDGGGDAPSTPVAQEESDSR